MTASICMKMVLDILTLQEWGVDLPSELIPSSATKAYTDFLHAVATKEVRAFLSDM